MLYYLVTALYILVCLTMMLVVYLQQGKGGDIASAFGGGGSSQSAFGARSGATVLSRATTIAAILFMVGALALGIIGKRGPSSVLGGRSPLSQPSTPATAPPTKAPVPAGVPSVPTNNAAPAPAKK
jgi:preprotein translocase subunit SecG